MTDRPNLSSMFRIFDTPVSQVHGYNAVDHSHDWKEQSDGDAYCPICGLYRSQIEKAKVLP